VWGTSLTNRAVFGTTGASNLPAVAGQSTGGRVGVHGFTGAGNPPPAVTETGVEGVCSLSAESNGVHGRSQGGAGAWGSTVGGLGVAGTASGDATGNGVGVYGFGPIGVFGEGAYAGWFAGPTLFTESGRAELSAGSSTTVAVPNGLRPTSLMFAVLHSNRPGVWVRAVVPNAAAGTATIHLNTAVSAATAIAWFVVDFPFEVEPPLAVVARRTP
jgi:hypothetical protein